MKRWNQKGSSAAKQRMAQLRLRKLEHARCDLAREYEARFGHHWLGDAKPFVTPAFQPMAPDVRVQEHIDWLRRSLA